MIQAQKKVVFQKNITFAYWVPNVHLAQAAEKDESNLAKSTFEKVLPLVRQLEAAQQNIITAKSA